MRIRYITSLILIAVNLYPLYGAFYLGLQFRDLIFIYCIETVIVLFFTLLKLYFLKTRDLRYKQDGILFLFVACVFNFFAYFVVTSNLYFTSLSEPFTKTNLTAMLMLFISHGISFLKNYIGNKEYLKLKYPRVIGPYFFRSITLFIVMNGADLFIAVILFKTFIDVLVHNFSHKVKN